MRIVAEWFLCDDAITRPTLPAQVLGYGGQPIHTRFLIDIGADRTVFSSALLVKVQLPTTPAPADIAFSSIGGQREFVVLTTTIELTRDDGKVARITGEFAAFTNPQATDLCILGRDVLNNFDLIISWPRREILLLAGNHGYQVTTATQLFQAAPGNSTSDSSA